MQNNKNPKDMLPLNPIVFNILSVMGTQTMHGYEIKKMVEADMDSLVPTATLYRHLKNMRDEGLLVEAPKPIKDDDPRRQYFKVTGFGEKVYAAEYNRLTTVHRDPKGLFGKGKVAQAKGF